MLLTRILWLLVILLLCLAYFNYLRKRMNYWENKEYFTPLSGGGENKEYFTTQLAEAPPPLKYTKPGAVDDPNYVNSDNMVYLKKQVDQLVLLKQQVAELQETSKGHDEALAALGKESYLNVVDPPHHPPQETATSEGGNASAVLESLKKKAVDAKLPE